MDCMGFKKEIWDFLRAFSECMGLAFRPIVEENGLTMMQTRILMEITQCEHPTVGSLGSVIGLSSGNASAMCKKLEKAGLIKRIRDPEDERYVILTLTAAGKETITKIEGALDNKYRTFFESKTEDEFREITLKMKNISSFIQEMSKQK